MNLVLTENQGAVRVLTLNRPEKMNAYNTALHDVLVAEIEKADHDKTVRAIVITGAGKAFCAGADISDGFSGAGLVKDVPQIDGINRDYGGMLTIRLFEANTPVIAAVNGVAVGIGLTMTLPMDIKIVSNKAKLGLPFARRGIVFDAASSWFLPRIVGLTKTQEWIATGRIFTAQEGYEAGLVSELTAPEKVLLRAMEIAQDIAQNISPRSFAHNKELIRRSLMHGGKYDAGGPMDAHMMESGMLMNAFPSDDCQEGVQSFFAKRPPNFKPWPR